MDRYEFLRKILPQGYGNFVATIGKKTDTKSAFWNRGFDTVEELADYCVHCSQNGLTAYFAIAAFINNKEHNEEGKVRWRRKADQVVALNAFVADIDCGEGKPYTNQRDGFNALKKFIADTGLPTPVVVASGNGLHCYWVMSGAVMKGQWVAVAERLKALFVEKEFHVDPSKVSDPALVLRPLDTINLKGGNSITLLIDTPTIDINTFAPLVEQKKTSALTAPAKPKKQSLNAQILAVFDDKIDYPPLVAGEIARRCPQIQIVAATGGRNEEEPIWYGASGLASYCIDPEYTAFEWAKNHPGFSEEGTREKMQQWVASTDGPPKCSYFDAKKPGICAGCTNWGKISSPAALGRPAPVAAVIDASTPARIEPPANYTFTTGGIVMTLVDTGVQEVVLKRWLFPTDIVFDFANGYEEVIWSYDKPMHGYVSFRVRSSHIFNNTPTELNACLADNGVLLPTLKHLTLVSTYMKAYVQKLQQEKRRVELYDSFGWKDNYTKFIIGHTEYSAEGEREVGVSRLIKEKKLDQAFTIEGDQNEWKALTRVLDVPGMGGHQFALGVAFASPLVVFTGLSGFLVSMLGDTGTGKSTMLQWVNSVYGNPKSLSMAKESTKMSIGQRMGMVSNLPVTVDELTLISNELVSDIIYWATHGKDKDRQTEALPLEWANASLVATNKSIAGKVVAINRDSSALLVRVLEFPYGKTQVFDSPWGKRISMTLQHNCGHVGREYARGLLKLGAAKLRERIAENAIFVRNRYGAVFTGEERYWEIGIQLVNLGLTLAREMGLIKFDHAAGIKWAVKNLESQRNRVEETAFNAFDLIADYVNEFNGASLTVGYNNAGRSIVHEPLPRGDVRIRKEIFLDASNKPHHGYMYLDKHHFTRWLSEEKVDINKVTRELRRAEAMRSIPSNRVTMGKHTPLVLPAIPVVSLNLSHPQFKSMLAHDEFPVSHEAEVVNLAAAQGGDTA